MLYVDLEVMAREVQVFVIVLSVAQMPGEFAVPLETPCSQLSYCVLLC